MTVNEELVCSAERSWERPTVLLGFAECRVPEFIGITVLVKCDVCVRCRVFDQHALTKEQWQEKVVSWHTEHKSLMR